MAEQTRERSQRGMVESQTESRVDALFRELVDAIREEARVTTAVDVQPVNLTDAAERCGLPRYRLDAWFHRGLLDEVGREKGPGSPKGVILVDMNQVRALVKNPPRPGPRGPRGSRSEGEGIGQ